MLVDQNNNYLSKSENGDIVISNESAFQFLKEKINIIFNNEIIVGNITFHEYKNRRLIQFELFKNKNKEIVFQQLSDTLESIVKSNLGLNIETITIFLRTNNA